MSESTSFEARTTKEGLNLPACLIIMDGYGLSSDTDINAIFKASTPVLDSLFKDMPWVKLAASGKDVGLPDGQMGNSEVGHLNIGAGRIVHQELSRINQACVDGSLAKNPVLNHAFSHVIEQGSVLNLMGLLSDGGVHSSNAHLYALLDAAVSAGVKEISVHCFLDGRDVPPQSAIEYVSELEDKITEISATTDAEIKIATLMGRYYAMDRDNRWERVSQAYRTLVSADNPSTDTPTDALKASYAAGVTDEFVVPMAFEDRGIQDGDAVIFFNFRPDRAREITRAFTDSAFSGFEREHAPQVEFVCLTEYDPTIPAPIAFPKTFPENVLADVLAAEGLSQLHIAETEKYAHVTFFLNGGVEKEKPGEKRMLIPSPKVATYDLQPEMSAGAVTDELVAAIENDDADVYIVNFANCDMVGHTGVMDAAMSAVEAVDAGVGRVVRAITDKGGFAFVTADHGNADCMVSQDGSPHTAHTTAPVPFILIDGTSKALKFNGNNGRLADIAPTLLCAIGLPVPDEMTGENLLAC